MAIARADLDYHLKKNLELYSNNINNNINFTHIKFGDGEIECMRGSIGENCDHHPYSKELGNKLKDALVNLSKMDNVYFADWYYSNPPVNPHDFPNYEYYNNIIKDLNINFIQSFELIMMGWGNMERPYLFNFYQKIKQSQRKKIYICPEKLNELKDIFKIDEFINIPLINAFSKYNEILDNAIKKIENDCIIFLSVGLQSPVLALDLLRFNKNITILDMGSGLDCYASIKTRHYDVSTEQARHYLRNL